MINLKPSGNNTRQRYLTAANGTEKWPQVDQELCHFFTQMVSLKCSKLFLSYLILFWIQPFLYITLLPIKAVFGFPLGGIFRAERNFSLSLPSPWSFLISSTREITRQRKHHLCHKGLMQILVIGENWEENILSGSNSIISGTVHRYVIWQWITNRSFQCGRH
jgi:hypothetical protein